MLLAWAKRKLSFPTRRYAHARVSLEYIRFGRLSRASLRGPAFGKERLFDGARFVLVVSAEREG